MNVFESSSGFCPSCGTIFPSLRAVGNITCYNCKQEFTAEVFGNMEVEYTIHFNTYDEKNLKANLKKESASDGPVVDRKCVKCGHDKMSYATVQLRSADEGQTVFFTCVNCHHKESENS